MSNIQVIEIKGINTKNTVKYAVCHDDFYFYSDNYNNLYTFDPSSPFNITTLSFPDKKVKGNVTTLDFSPSRKYAAAGYSDGSLQVFNLDTNKPYKLLSKHNDQDKPNKSVQDIVFYSDTFLLATFSDGSLFSYKIALISRVTLIKSFTSTPVGLYRPGIYRFVEGKVNDSKVVLPNFINCYAISSEKSFQFSLLDKDLTSSINILEITDGNLKACFYNIDSCNVLMALTYTDKVEVYALSYAENLQISKKSSVQTIFPLAFLSFLSSMILIGHDQDCQRFLILSLDTNSSTEISSPMNGLSILGGTNNGPVFFKNQKLYRLSLQPFKSTIESFSESVEQAESAIELCKRAISNDPLATIGLPNNQNQRILVIERSISRILENYLSSMLDKHPENGESIADKFIKIAINLKLQEWLVNQAFQIFESQGKSRIIIKKIIETDPCATLFTYNNNFVQSILDSFEDEADDENENGISISNFLLSLPKQILSPVEIIKYAEKTGSRFLLSQVYALRLNDIKSALQVLANADMFSKVCLIIIHNQDKSDISMLWSFTFYEGKFPLIKKICQCKEAQDVFLLFESLIEEKRSPINISDYVNAMIQSLYSLQKDQAEIEDTEFVNNYLIKMENLIITKQVKLLASTLRCVVSHIFAQKLNDNDPNKKRLEKILIYILSSDVPVQFKELLINLCESYGYNEAKRRMEEGAKKYERLIKENLSDPEKDVFELINNMLNNAQSNANELTLAHSSIKNSLFTFAPYFIVKDVKKLSNLINERFPDSALAIVREVQNENMRNIFIRNLYKANPKVEFLRLPSDLFLKFITYLSKYYPPEVYGIIHLYPLSEIPVKELIPICTDYNIYDACAYLYEMTNNTTKASECLIIFQQVNLLLFAQKKVSIETAESVTKFILQFIKERVKKNSFIDETRKMLVQLVNAMLAPLYQLQKTNVQNNDERIDFLTTYLKTISSLAANVVPYPVLLDIFIQHFKELHYGYTKLALSSIMNDYAYDLDTNNAMCQLYRQDERNDHSKLILNSICGTENDNLVCCTCKKRLVGVLDQIQIFQCGHAFHRNMNCLPKQVCPVCNPEERLDQDIPLHMLSVSIGKSLLRRFEYNLKMNNSVFSKKEKFEDKKSHIVINPKIFINV